MGKSRHIIKKRAFWKKPGSSGAKVQYVPFLPSVRDYYPLLWATRIKTVVPGTLPQPVAALLNCGLAGLCDVVPYGAIFKWIFYREIGEIIKLLSSTLLIPSPLSPQI